MLSGYKILVAEDNPLNQKIAGLLLEKNGATFVLVSNGLDAVKELETNHFDLVLMDLYMPEMDGYEATAYIRNVMKNDIPIIALSASNFDDEIKKCLDAGMNASVSKPFDPEKIMKLILELTNETKITT